MSGIRVWTFILTAALGRWLSFTLVLNLRQEFICDACDQIRQRIFAVGAVRAVFQDVHFTSRKLLAESVQFAGFRAWIEAAVNEQCRRLDLAQSAGVEIVVWIIAFIRDLQPSLGVAGNQLPPIIRAV